MVVDNGDDTSSPLTVADAGSAIEGLLFPKENTSGESHEQQAEAAETDAKIPAPDAAEQSDAEAADDSATEDNEQDDEANATPRYKVKVGDDEELVTLDEALKGYMRQQDYTRKRQADAEARRKFEAEELPAVQAERKQYAEALTQLESAILASTPQEPDWELARQKLPPAEFAAAYAEWDAHKQQVARLDAERQRAAQAVQADNAKQYAHLVEQEHAKLVAAIPEWSKPDKQKAEKAEMVQFAKGVGFTEQELAGITDHRVMLVLRAAMLHDKASKGTPALAQKVQQAVKTAAPGVSGSVKTAPESKRITSMRQRLAKTGRVEDAAALIEQTLEL